MSVQTSNSQGLLIRPFFIVCLSVLLLNDFVWKYEFSNTLTGKLSDVAGLFIFPYFISSFKVKYTKQIYCFTILLFIFWKSSLSEEMINWVNNLGIKVYRTVDYSDFLALIIIPCSYKYFRLQMSKTTNCKPILTAMLSIVSVFSFCATTVPHQEIKVKVDTDRNFQLNMTKKEFFSLMTAAHPYSDSTYKNLRDSLFYLYFDIPELRAQPMVLAIVTSSNSDKVTIKLDSIISSNITGSFFSKIKQENVDNIKNLTSEEWEKYFEENFVKKLQSKDSIGDLYYDNKEIANQYSSGQ